MTDLSGIQDDLNSTNNSFSQDGISKNLSENEVCIMISNESNNLSTKKSISVYEAFSLVFGTIVGSGIFMGVQEPYMIFESHSILFVMLLWLIFGIICIFGGLCYAELGTRIPESGGDRAYLKRIIGPKISRIFVIFYVFIIRTLSISGLTITAATYIMKIFMNNPENQYYLCRFIAILIIFVCFTINCFSKSLATKTGVFTTVTKTIAILIIICSGIYFLSKNETKSWAEYNGAKNFSIDQLGFAMLAIFWSYDGCNTLGMVAGDMVNPARDLPISIIFGIGIVVVLYVLTVISYPAILGYELAKNSSGVAYDCAHKIFGRAAPIMSILIFSSAFGSANSVIFSISSTATSAGLIGELPKIFSLVHRKKRTYIFSGFIILILSSIGTFLDFNTILGYVSFTAVIFYSLTYLSLWKIKLKTKLDKNEGIFQIPFLLIIPPQVLSLIMIVLSFKVRKVECLILTIILLVSFQLQYIIIPDDNKLYIWIKEKHSAFIQFMEDHFSMDLATMNDIS